MALDMRSKAVYTVYMSQETAPKPAPSPAQLRRRRLNVARHYGVPKAHGNPASAAEVARRLGVSPVTFYRWEFGKHTPSDDALMAWSAVVESVEQIHRLTRARKVGA